MHTRMHPSSALHVWHRHIVAVPPQCRRLPRTLGAPAEAFVHRARKVLASPCLHSIVAALILLNAVVIGFETDDPQHEDAVPAPSADCGAHRGSRSCRLPPPYSFWLRSMLMCTGYCRIRSCAACASSHASTCYGPGSVALKVASRGMHSTRALLGNARPNVALA